jgi:four helix bundle protein
MITDYTDLIAWQKGMDLVELVYRLTAQFSGGERFGLVAQLRRAAVSIPSNIAEGFGRSGKADFTHFLDMALGSTNEVATQLLLAVRLGFVEAAQARPSSALTAEVGHILKGLIRSVNGTPRSMRTPAKNEAAIRPARRPAN